MVLEDGTAKDQKQAAAICYSMYREKKGMEEKDIYVEGAINRPMGGATSFAEWRENEKAREAVWQAQDLTWQFQDLLNNIMSSDSIEDKGAAIRGLTDEFLGLLEDLPKSKSLWAHIKEAFNKEKPIKQKDSEKPSFAGPQEDIGSKNIHPFMVWKEGSSYRWLAIYSNKWRDNDNPPEILAEVAHKEFVDAVDKGDWPYPESWLWHIEGTRFGVADFVAYEDSGFALASGTVDKGKEDVAEALSKMDNLATSHGMPVKEIQRDGTDPSIITRYRTVEISPLPFEAAANKHGTGFQILQAKEVDEMALPTKKRPFLEETLGVEGVAALEQMLQDKAKEIQERGIEFKEETVEEVEAVESEVPEEVQEEVTEPKESEPVYVTADELVQAFEQYIKPIVAQMSSLTQSLEAHSGEIKEQRAALKELQKDDETKLKAALSETPAASLFARIGSVIGSDETYVDGRTSLAKSGPQQTKDSNGPTPVGLLNELIAQSNAYGG